MSTVFAIGAMVVGALATLMMLTLCVAGAPNSSPEQLRTIKLWMLAIAIVGVLTLGGGIWLAISGKAWMAAAISALPALSIFVLMVWLSFK